MIVVSSVNGRHVDNSEGSFEREMIKKLEAERGEGPPTDLQNEFLLVTAAGPAASERTEELAPIETNEDPVSSDEIPEGNDISLATSKISLIIQESYRLNI